MDRRRETACSFRARTRKVKLGLEFDALVRRTLLPAYRPALDALDPVAALELATHIVGAVRAAQRGDADAANALKPGARCSARISAEHLARQRSSPAGAQVVCCELDVAPVRPWSSSSGGRGWRRQGRWQRDRSRRRWHQGQSG
jgi:hypothetical protein